MVRFLTALCLLSSFACTAFAQDDRVRLEQHEDRISVHIDDQLFTEYIFQGYEKPILYPVIGPHGVRMTRDFPMKLGTPNEADDHPHHKSIWFGHMKVNGESFWHVGDNAGTTEQTDVSVQEDTLRSVNRLVDRDGQLVAIDSRELRFSAQGDLRFIDYAVTYHAVLSPITFGDNKDGQMGIRMHPSLRIKGPVASGQAINAKGDRESDIWGKRASWIDYWGDIDGHVVGIAMFDHPSNLRHPTWWHARDYGLLSANPFGIHHFEEQPDPKLGDYTLPEHESLTFRHRFVFHPGDYQQAQIADLYQQWAQPESAEPAAASDGDDSN